MNSARQVINNDGFFIARNVISPATIDRVLRDMHFAVKLQLEFLNAETHTETNRDNLFADLKSLYKLDQERYLSTLKVCGKLMSVFQLYLAPSLISVIKDIGIELPLFQTQPVLNMMAEALRIKDGYFGVGAHQDWPALQSGLDTLTCWIPLFNVRKNQFALEIIPKSHLLGLVDAKQEQHIHEVDPKVYEDMFFQAVELDAGDALIFSSFLIHKSGVHGAADAFRLAFSMRYENGRDTNFIRRSYPYAQKRVVDRFLAEKDIPTRQEILAIYSQK